MMAANPSVHVFTSARITSMCSLSVDTQQSSQIKLEMSVRSCFIFHSAYKKTPTKTLIAFVPAMKKPSQGVTVHIRESTDWALEASHI